MCAKWVDVHLGDTKWQQLGLGAVVGASDGCGLKCSGTRRDIAGLKRLSLLVCKTGVVVAQGVDHKKEMVIM